MRKPQHFALPLVLVLSGLGLLLSHAQETATSNRDEQEAAEPAGTGTAVRAGAIEIRGPIGPATSDFFLRSLEKASEEGMDLFLLEMDTPGGLDSAMRDIIKGILGASIPVVTYVSPSGSRAASAGTYILYASHVAAMAPATNLGAATPVQIGAPPAPADDKEKEKDKAKETSEETEEKTDKETKEKKAEEKGTTPSPSTAMERKAVNDAVAYIRGLAEMRGRNAEWAEKAVREAASLSAEQALEANVVDVVAANRAELLEKINGLTVKVDDREVKINTEGLVVTEYEPDWRTKLLAVITDPNVAYLLMLIGIYGLIFEGYNPGAVVPGVVGAICLLLALFAFQVLPVNYAGLALILLGVILMVAEAFVPSFGALGIGGIVAFVIGSIILIDADVPGFGVSRPLIGSFALFAGLLLMAIIAYAVKMRRRPVVSGTPHMIGATGEATVDFNGGGQVFVLGELWNARADTPIRKGDRVTINKVDGLLLHVQPKEQQEN